MVDRIASKRVLPDRDRRSSAVKRRASSPPAVNVPEPKQSAAQRPESRQKRKYAKRNGSLPQPETPAAVETPPASPREVLPFSLDDSKPLPTTLHKQPTTVSLKDYQSIAESAVLAASLHKSRVQWLCDGIFKKYWTKPIKRKGVTEVPPNNPDPKSMHKLGNATVTIEPHTFDVAFFAVRDPQSSVPYQRHPNQHTPKPPFQPSPYGTMYYPPTPPHAYPPQPPPTPPQHGFPTQPPSGMPQTPQPYTPVPSNPVPAAHTAQPPSMPTDSQVNPVVSPPAPNQVATTSSALPKLPESSQAPKIKQEVVSQSPSHAVTPVLASSSTPIPQQAPLPGERRPEPPAPTNRANNDPVIHMLARRAASSPRLKELMKIVAASKASPEQLKEFQSHIDEFNAVLKRQEMLQKEHEQQQREVKPDVKPMSKPSTPNHNASPAASHPAMYNATNGPPRPPMGPTGPFPRPPQYMAYPPPPRPEPKTKHIIMEFTTAASSTQPASQDRWLFPDYAVLDLRYGGLEMVCSFFVERKGSDILAAIRSNTEERGEEEDSTALPQYKPDEDYYQPVTMVVKATSHRIIETIARAANSLSAVQEYMKNVMQTKTRAPEEFLAHHLPRESIEHPTVDFVDSAVEMVSEEEELEDDELKDFYGNQ